MPLALAAALDVVLPVVLSESRRLTSFSSAATSAKRGTGAVGLALPTVLMAARPPARRITVRSVAVTFWRRSGKSRDSAFVGSPESVSQVATAVPPVGTIC